MKNYNGFTMFGKIAKFYFKNKITIRLFRVKFSRKLCSIKGLSLLELMIAMSLSTFVMLGSSSVYMSCKGLGKNAGYNSQAEVNAMLAIKHIKKYASQAITRFTVSDDGSTVTFVSIETKNDISSNVGLSRKYEFSKPALKFYKDANKSDFEYVSNCVNSCVFDDHQRNILDIKLTTTANESANNVYEISTKINALYSSFPV
jgi:hypothetical protein